MIQGGQLSRAGNLLKVLMATGLKQTTNHS
jgi:hypothetical protein